MIAVGAGGVWTGNRQKAPSPASTPRPARSWRRSTTFARRIAAGREGVWVLGGAGHDLISGSTRARTKPPSTSSSAPTRCLGSRSAPARSGRRLGGGQLWRVDPEPPPVTQTIDVGVGTRVRRVRRRAGLDRHFVDGTSRASIRETNAVTANVTRRRVAGSGGGRGLGLGQRGRAGRATVCCRPRRAARWAGGRKPDVLIASDLPLQGAARRRAPRDGRRDPLRAQGPRLPRRRLHGRLPVVRRLDRAVGDAERRKCAANANAYARAASSSR